MEQPMVTPQMVKTWIEEGLPGASAQVSGDGRHFEAIVVHADFEGRSMIEQHRLVYAGLGDKMASTIHALSLRTYANTDQR